ncbi:MAG: hypothetical protein QOF03_1812 [Alphaproteobacteria bacterium]|jgi:hypothetical protein|nr:hypothetical protein [Alphaproteobacteria bacterium]
MKTNTFGALVLSGAALLLLGCNQNNPTPGAAAPGAAVVVPAPGPTVVVPEPTPGPPGPPGPEGAPGAPAPAPAP